MIITAAEQYAIELINRARLDPAAEAARQKIALNADLAAGTISTSAKQVLAPLDVVDDAADAHATWMLKTGAFSHYGPGGSTPGDRLAAAGYSFTGVWGWGENIAARTFGGMSLQKMIETQHADFYGSTLHRANMFIETHREIGYAQEIGNYRNSGSTSVVVEDYAYRNKVAYVTGVAYTDRSGDGFYSIGEGVSGLALKLVGGPATTTMTAGGYALAATPGQMVSLRIGADTLVAVDLTQGNVKVDVVDGDTLMVSGSVDLLEGIAKVTALGVGSFNIAGNAAANVLIGNSGNNIMSGDEGRDRLLGGAGNDSLMGGVAADTLRGEDGNDRIWGDENADILDGGAGTDVLAGGDGADVFVFGDGYGADRITDFSLAAGDRLQLDDALWPGTMAALRVTNSFAEVTRAGVVFDFGAGDTLTLTGVTTLAGLAAAIDLV